LGSRKPQGLPTTDWVCFVAGPPRTDVCPVRDVYRGLNHLRHKPPSTRRARPAGRLRTFEGKMALFCEMLVRRTSIPEAFGVHGVPVSMRFERRDLRLGDGNHASSKRHADQADDPLATPRIHLVGVARDRASILMRAERPLEKTSAHKHTNEPKIGYCPSRPPWPSVWSVEESIQGNSIAN
jgi:hypothetical protein